MNTAILCAGLLALLLMALSLTVSLTRLKESRGFGVGDSKAWISRATRAQGNAAEYIPLFILLILILEQEGSPNWADWVYVAAVLVRVSHAAGMLMSSDLDKVHPLRLIGSAGTYACGFILSLLVIQGAL